MLPLGEIRWHKNLREYRGALGLTGVLQQQLIKKRSASNSTETWSETSLSINCLPMARGCNEIVKVPSSPNHSWCCNNAKMYLNVFKICNSYNGAEEKTNFLKSWMFWSFQTFGAFLLLVNKLNVDLKLPIFKILSPLLIWIFIRFGVKISLLRQRTFNWIYPWP